jgi:hypothetical protein
LPTCAGWSGDCTAVRLVNLADDRGFSRLGILNRACNDPARLAVVLLDRVGEVLRSTCDEHNILRDARQLAAILSHYAVGLDPD